MVKYKYLGEAGKKVNTPDWMAGVFYLQQGGGGRNDAMTLCKLTVVVDATRS